MKNIKLYLLLALTIIGLGSAEAKISLPSLLSDNAVFQRNTTILLWGSATPSQKVKVTPSWSGETYTTKANAKGQWSVEVATTDAGEGYSISFSDGGEELTINNILLGEVWLCSGQSNMEMKVQGFGSQPVQGAADLILKAKASTPIRMYKVERNIAKKPLDDTAGAWGVNAPANIPNFSAVAYHYALYLQEVLGVPVGIIDCSWGGTRIQPWMSPEMLNRVGEYDMSHLEKAEVTPKDHQKACSIYNGMLHTLFRYKIKGMLWYQGESNRHNPEEYLALLPSFVEGVRSSFDCGNFPFYYAEIAPFGYKDSGTKSVRLREIMGEASELIDNCGMISLLDVGEENLIHPSNKRPVGERFAYLALGDTYGFKGVEYRTPRYQEIKVIEGDSKRPARIAVKFSNAHRGLCVLPDQTSQLFEIAGADKVFYPASMQILRSGDYQLEVWSERVPEPVAVRYACDIFVKGDIFNMSGLPISSFRSDSWEL